MDNGVNYELHLVFDYDSLSDKHKQELLDFCGVEEGETNSMDSIQCGFSILMASEYIKDATDIDEEIVNKIASVYFFIDRLRGFYFDKPINRIGTKGWDWINHIINGKKIKFFG